MSRIALGKEIDITKLRKKFFYSVLIIIIGLICVIISYNIKTKD